MKDFENISISFFYCPVLSLQVFLVGDPIQLPATVISKRAVSYGYDVSLFKRLQTAGYPVQVLDTQYRMHPDICRFPSNQFYQGGVKTGEGVEAATRRPWHAQKVSQNLYVQHVNVYKLKESMK